MQQNFTQGYKLNANEDNDGACYIVLYLSRASYDGADASPSECWMLIF